MWLRSCLLACTGVCVLHAMEYPREYNYKHVWMEEKTNKQTKTACKEQQEQLLCKREEQSR